MPKVSQETAEKFEDWGPAGKEWSQMLAGQHFSFVQIGDEDADLTPLLKGLPNDQCHCPHWGYVLEGEIWWRYGDREETVKAGEAFYTPPGHTAGAHAHARFVVISPEQAMVELQAHMAKRAQEMGAPA